MKAKFLLGTFALVAIACNAGSAEQSAPNSYKLTVDGGVANDQMVYLVNYDTGEKTDSVVASGSQAVFTGIVETPYVARVLTSDGRLGNVIIEEGDLVLANKEVKGGELNARLNKFYAEVQKLQDQFRMATTEEEQQNIFDKYIELSTITLADNADNAVGYSILVDMLGDLSQEDLDSLLKEYPAMANYKRVKDMQDIFARKDATSAGKMFTDFEIEYDGKTTRLSDFVGKGKYTLVDFWASWCGPCRREATTTVKDLYNQYHDKGLDIVGIAVWDEPEASIKAAQQWGLPWTQVVNGQTIPTDLYGIQGIPCIILFGPDGKIIFRDLQGEMLKAAVDGVMSSAATE